MMAVLWLKRGRGKVWTARIAGLDTKYGLAREFLKAVDKGKDGKAYLLEEDQLYQTQSAAGRQFLVIRDGKQVVLDIEDAMKIVSELEEARKRERAEADDMIGRINLNAEGGFSVVDEEDEDEEDEDEEDEDEEDEDEEYDR